MISTTLLFIMLNCPATDITNLTDTWTDKDEQTLISAGDRCYKIYPDSPCLIRFWKMEELTYRAICGEPRKK